MNELRERQPPLELTAHARASRNRGTRRPTPRARTHPCSSPGGVSAGAAIDRLIHSPQHLRPFQFQQGGHMTVPFSTAHLQDLGFAGFTALQTVPRRSIAIPDRSGVYVVVAGPANPREFLTRSVGGHFKATDPTVPLALLDRRVVPGAETLYLGKANSLRRRIGEYADYGRGKPIGHRGGRLIWQLRDHRELLVAWLIDDDPAAREPTRLTLRRGLRQSAVRQPRPATPPSGRLTRP